MVGCIAHALPNSSMSKSSIKSLFAVLAVSVLGIGCVQLPPLAVSKVGSFFVGGRDVQLSGLPEKQSVSAGGVPSGKINPNGEFVSGQMYARYTSLEAPRGKYPLLLWHGGGLTGVTWETTPDGRPGWEMYFLRSGWDVFVSDAVERGRASWSQYPEIYSTEPLFRGKAEAWQLFRIGPRYATEPMKRETFPGTQFPVDAFDEFAKQGVPRWTGNDAEAQKAYDLYVTKVCPCVVIAHSQSGAFAINAALRQPEMIKALILIEPFVAPDPTKTDLTRMRSVPMLWLWGDNIQSSPLSIQVLQKQEQFRTALANAGGRGDVIKLPERGIRGNTHMMMMDRNSDQVAGVVNQWLVERGLVK